MTTLGGIGCLTNSATDDDQTSTDDEVDLEDDDGVSGSDGADGSDSDSNSDDDGDSSQGFDRICYGIEGEEVPCPDPCGDGICAPDEDCNACELDCGSCPARCGDGQLDDGEACDDGNQVPADGCNALCQAEECGNGILDAGESCDDGNTIDDDGCTNGCVSEACGDALCTVELETCRSCETDCGACPVTCGDGYLEGDEECDDGNTSNNDGCSSICEIETPSDDCGNGLTEDGETCDDGNMLDGDGCSRFCQVEVGYDCSPERVFGELTTNPVTQCAVRPRPDTASGLEVMAGPIYVQNIGGCHKMTNTHWSNYTSIEFPLPDGSGMQWHHRIFVPNGGTWSEISSPTEEECEANSFLGEIRSYVTGSGTLYAWCGDNDCNYNHDSENTIRVWQPSICQLASE